MTSTVMSTTSIARELEHLIGVEGQTVATPGHVLVMDGYVTAVYTREQAQRLLEVWQYNIDAEIEDAYSFACCATSPTQDADIPAEEAEMMRDWLGLDADAPLNRGY